MFSNFAAYNLILTTMKRYFFVALLLLAAGIQTAQAQSMMVRTSDGRLVPFGVEEVDSVFFTDANYVGGHEYIDLGLPSGTLWASCNVGADTPEAYGELFAWGETTPPPVLDAYGWDTYSLCEGTMRTINKYNDNDHMTWLKPSDDAACNWGSMWQMPSKEQFEELINPDYSLLEFVTQNGVVGLKVTSKINGNAIFLPAAGEYAYNGYEGAGMKGCYWSRTRYAGEPWFAHLLLFQPRFDNIISTYGYRFCGQSVRPVRYKEVKYVDEITLSETALDLYPGETFQLSATVSPADAVNTEVRWVSSEPNVATVSEDGFVTSNDAISNLSCTITCYALDGSGTKAECQVTVCEYVDLGLPSGTLWAKCNIGATCPEDYGTYFAWGETKGKEEYDWSTYKYCSGARTTLKKYCYDKSYGYNNFFDGMTELTLYDDASTQAWGSSWRIPSYTQLVELLDNTEHIMATCNGVDGCLLTSTVNDKSIFLPAAGWYNKNSGLCYVGRDGYYWSSSLSINEPYKATSLHLWGNIYSPFVYDDDRCNGMTVRPVRTIDLPMPDVRRIILSETNLKFDIGEATTTTLTATILPSNASIAVSWSSNNTSVATVNSNGLVTPVGVGTCTITCTAADGSGVKSECQVTVERLSGTYNGHQWVDLGLESGTLWATCNVGSSTPEEMGELYAWGEYSTKSEYTYSNYKWGVSGSKTEQYTKYTYADGDTEGNWYDSNGNFIGDGIRELQPADDAAYRRWGTSWQTPSVAQLQELFYETFYGDRTFKTWTTINGVSGYKITSKSTGKSIFFPASGNSAMYWSNKLSGSKTVSTLWIKYNLNTYNHFDFFHVPRYDGNYIRPVVRQ